MLQSKLLCLNVNWTIEIQNLSLKIVCPFHSFLGLTYSQIPKFFVLYILKTQALECFGGMPFYNCNAGDIFGIFAFLAYVNKVVLSIQKCYLKT